jgi:hypothetical protein
MPCNAQSKHDSSFTALNNKVEELLRKLNDQEVTISSLLIKSNEQGGN